MKEGTFVKAIRAIDFSLRRMNVSWALFGSCVVAMFDAYRQPSDIDIFVKDRDFHKLDEAFRQNLTRQYGWHQVKKLKVLSASYRVDSWVMDVVTESEVSLDHRIVKLNIDRIVDEAEIMTKKGWPQIPIISVEDFVLFKLISRRADSEGKRDLEDAKTIIHVADIDWPKVYEKSLELNVLDVVRDSLEKIHEHPSLSILGDPVLGNKDSKEGILLQGIGASKGKIAGQAVVVVDSIEISKIKEKNILVAPRTDPDFVVSFGLVAGVVTDTGGLTSHAAVICREMGIPCVVSVCEATKTIRDGDWLEIDGKKGTVFVSRKES